MENPDAQTIDALVTALYETISGPAGPRDWERERRLLAPGAILVPPGPAPDPGTDRPAPRPAPAVLDIDGYIASRSPYFARNDLSERETARRTFLFGNIAHVLSAYEARRRADDAAPLWRGINSIQLYNDGRRWWVASILWDNERPDNPVPEWARRNSSP